MKREIIISPVRAEKYIKQDLGCTQRVPTLEVLVGRVGAKLLPKDESEEAVSSCESVAIPIELGAPPV